MKTIETIKPARKFDWNQALSAPLKLQAEEELLLSQPAPPIVIAEPPPKKSIERQALLVALLCVLSLGSYYVMSRFCISSVQVSGRSMTPTLHDGERYLLNRLCYFYRDPMPGEVVVIRDPGHSDFAVKRIVAGPSDRIVFEEGRVLVNGQELKETYLASGTKTLLPQTKPHMIVLGKNQYFVLGDNRGMSEDSRYYGAISKSSIVGPIWR